LCKIKSLLKISEKKSQLIKILVDPKKWKVQI